MRKWQESSTLYLAKCGNCDSDMKNNAKAMKCNLCGATKPSHAFSPARQRARDYSTWRCKDCDFPACSSCGAIPPSPSRSHKCVLCANSHLALAEPSDFIPSNITSRRSRLGNAKRADSKHSSNVWMQQTATAASLQSVLLHAWPANEKSLIFPAVNR